MCSILYKIGIELSPLSFCRMGRSVTRRLCRGTTRCTYLDNGRAILSVCYKANAVNLSVTGGTGEVVKTRVIPRTILSTGHGTLRGNVRGTRFVYTSTKRTTRRLSSHKVGPSIILLSPPHGNYSRVLLTRVIGVSPRHVICISYSPSALTESYFELGSLKCRAGQLTTTSLFPHAIRIRDITLLAGRGWNMFIFCNLYLAGILC